MPVRHGDAKHAAAHLIAAAGRCVHVANQVDYSIRRWMIPAHDEPDRPVAAAARARSAVVRQASPVPRAKASRPQRAGALSEVQVAIARALGAEYDLAEPLPNRLADLLRQLERRHGAGGHGDLAARRI